MFGARGTIESIMLDQLLDVVCTPLFIRLPGVRMFRPSILVAIEDGLLSFILVARLGSVRPPIARRASDEELIAAESLALLLTDATWGDPLCSPGRASRISMRDAYKCGFIGCRNATIAASACGDRANGVCGISMDLGLALVGRGKCRASARRFASNFG